MQIRLVTTLTLILVLIAACAAPQGESAPAATTSQGGEPTGTTEATAEPTSTLAELSLPGDITLEPIGDSTVTGAARFNQMTEDAFAISIQNIGSDLDSPLGFAAVLLPGTCADQSEPADFAGALDTQTFDAGETPAFQVTAAQVGEILASPHSILITNGPGDRNLACGDIGG